MESDQISDDDAARSYIRDWVPDHVRDFIAADLAARVEAERERVAKWHDGEAKKAGTWRDWGGPSDKALQAKEAFHIEAAAAIRAGAKS